MGLPVALGLQLGFMEVGVADPPLDFTHPTCDTQVPAFGEVAQEVCLSFLLEPRVRVFQAE